MPLSGLREVFDDFFKRPDAPLPNLRRRAASLESAARLVVQKIARENAARHAYDRDYPTSPAMHGRLRRTWLLAKHEREAAVVFLRHELGLPDHPTQAECGTWGEAP